ncbi:MAG: sigma-54-dependent Fis family transcriptional regulator [Methylobacteriaceae bacterium]|nr:sigma-54-dependent Fis family transcriptional regulator [Methylobacteriaceae bacterium]
MERHAAGAHRQRIHAAIATSEAARSPLVASWKRSSELHRLDPSGRRETVYADEGRLREARQALEPLTRVARPSLERLFLAVGGAGCCVILADRHGVAVERLGSGGDDRHFRDLGLWTGAIWSETEQGTNGIGTCLVERRAVTIHRDQHFFTGNAALSCTAVPLHDHEGRFVAVLDISSCRNDLTEALVQVIALAVAESARRIEIDLFRRAFPDARVMLAPTADGNPAALVAVDGHDLVIGASRAARKALDIGGGPIAGRLSARDLFGGADRGPESLVAAERSVYRRALARHAGNVTAAARELGVSRATLHRKLNQLRLRAND